jgi:molybdopterin-guanine dinucleotide biosynthesis protein A
MLSIVIQAGGESSRMGQDKALMPFLGQPLIQRVLARVEKLGDEILVTTNHPDDYRFLGLRLVPDIIPGRGALGGLYTALSAASEPLVAVVACDMPFVSASLLAAERDLLSDPGLDAAIPKTGHGTEPFHATYRRSTCLPAVEWAIEAEKWRADAWYARANLHFLSPEEVRRHDPEEMAFWNVNTPDELEKAERVASQQDGPAPIN